MVDFRHGRDRALASTAAGPLFDGDGRGNPKNRVHVGARGRLDELARIGVQRFEVAALAFGEQDIECQRALAAAADAGDDGKLVTGNIDIDALEIVLARVVDADRMIWACCVQRRGRFSDLQERRRAAQRGAGVTAFALRHVGGRAHADDFAAGIAALRPEIDDPIRRANDIEVVFDHDDGVAALDELAKGAQQRGDIIEMKARRRLVE